jgi:hypothetical protein
MNDPTKVAPYVCHIPNKKLQMSVTLQGMPPTHFEEDQQQIFKQAVFSGMKKYISTFQPIQLETAAQQRRAVPNTRRDTRRRRRSQRKGTGCTSKPPTGQPAWANCFGLSVQVQCEQAAGMPFYCVWGQPTPAKALPTCKPCKAYAFMQMGYSQYCQDAAGKCWATQQCNGVGTLCQVGKPAAVPTCCLGLCPNSTNATHIPVVEPINITAGGTTSYTSAAIGGSTLVPFSIDLSNVDPALYDQASSSLNAFFKGNTTSRRSGDSDTFLPTAQSMASTQGVSFPVTSVSINAYSASYAQQYPSSEQNSSSSNTALVAVMVTLAVVIICAAIVGVGYWYRYHKKSDDETAGVVIVPQYGVEDKPTGEDKDPPAIPAKNHSVQV